MTKQKKYYLKNKEKCNLAVKKWKSNNPEKVKSQGVIDSKKYRERHKDRIKDYDNNRRPANITRKNNMKKLREEKGNRCSMCGYNKESRILQFHHLGDKEFNISDGNISYERMKKEADKCILLCPNCHHIIHLTI